MLHKLVNQGADLYPNDAEKRSVIFEKYKHYQISVRDSCSFCFDPSVLFRKKKSIGSVCCRRKPWRNWRRKRTRITRNRFDRGKNISVNRWSLNFLDDWKTTNRSISLRCPPNRKRQACSVSLTLLFVRRFRAPKTLKEKVINKLWRSWSCLTVFL